jgi:16S rRNA (uracil1498-N3)-methyltransferase
LPADAAPAYLFVPALQPEGGRVTLADEPAHYLARVCRARVGDFASLTDGVGTVARAEVTALGSRVELVVRGVERRPRARRLDLWCGAPEGTRADWLVEKLAELGIAALQPIETSRATWDSFERRAARWRRLAEAALRQSRGAWALEIRAPLALEAALGAWDRMTRGVLADVLGKTGVAPRASGDCVGLVGPAEGLTGDERSRVLDAGFDPMRLSDNRLRSETAALAVACWWAGAVTDGATDGV